MKNVFKKIGMVATILAMMLFAQMTVDNLSTTANAQDEPIDYVWGTLEMVAGIAVCDGTPYNCTHPAPPPCADCPPDPPCQDCPPPCPDCPPDPPCPDCPPPCPDCPPDPPCEGC